MRRGDGPFGQAQILSEFRPRVMKEQLVEASYMIRQLAALDALVALLEKNEVFKHRQGGFEFITRPFQEFAKLRQ